jgi:tetratricopeptide (TPR) repeat protein
MQTKILFPAIAIVTIVFMGVYFWLNPSYERSMEAKYYYEIGEYKEAYELANEAFSMDIYNRMASTIMAQSKTSLKYVAYIEQAKGYLQEINAMAENESINEAQRAKIKLMSEVVVSSYKKLAPSVITDKELVEEAATYNAKFEKLLEKVNK